MSSYLRISTKLTDATVVGAAAKACGFQLKHISEAGKNEFDVRSTYYGNSRQKCCVVVKHGNREIGFYRQDGDNTLGVVGYSGEKTSVERIIRAATALSAVQKAKAKRFSLVGDMNLNPEDVDASVRVVMRRIV